MKVLYVINGFDPGGAEHGLLTLVKDGYFQGHELTVFGFCRGKGDLATRVGDAVSSNPLVLATKDTRITPVGAIRGAAALVSLFRREQPDIVVLSLKQANVIGRFLLVFFPKIYCVAFEHIGRYRARRVQWLYPKLLRLLSFRVDEVWADCKQTLLETRTYFSARQRTETVVPLFRAEPKGRYKRDFGLHDPLRLVAAGRLTARKNFGRLVEAVSILRRSRDVELAVFGDGDERARLEELIAEKGLPDRVRLMGYHDRWFEHQAALSADMFVNLSDTEGFCIVVAEAMAIGLPVIATDVGGIRDYGMDGENMLKLSGPDSQNLVEAVHRLAEDAPLRQALGKSARAAMIQSYSPGITASLSGKCRTRK